MSNAHRNTTFAYLILGAVSVGGLLSAGCREETDLGFGGIGGEGNGSTSSATSKASSSASTTSTTTTTSTSSSSTTTDASSTASTADSASASGTSSSSTTASSSSGMMMPEVCDNDVDDNGNGLVDCDDPACNGDGGAALGGDCTPIQFIQDGTHVGASTIDRVFVTGKRVAGGGAVTLWVQEPQGHNAGNHVYPEYAGVEVFIGSTDVGGFPDLASVVVGDCVSISGTPTEFQMVTELTALSAFTRHAGGCAQMPTPYVIDTTAGTFDELASDENPVLAEDQYGARNESFEGVLVRVDDVVATEADNNGDFRVSPAAGMELLRIERFIFATSAEDGDTFTSITGVYDQFSTRYRVLPRSAADVVQ